MPVKVKKANGQTATFSDLIWKNMGTSRNGWIPVDQELTPVVVSNVKNDLDKESRYKALVGQGDGFMADGKYQDAKAKYQAAANLKSSSYITGLINKAKAAQLSVLKEQEFDELIDSGDAAYKAEDFIRALELFGSAKSIEATEYVTEMIAKCEKAIEA